jgi:D-3-phosphoglycerate dehydrogenase
MFNIKTINNISDKGLSRLPSEKYTINPDEENPDAIILRSAKLHDMEIPANLKAVGRAGAGTNNVPVERLGNEGIVVFNAPGANANAVKELVIAGMLLACRNICQAWQYAANVEGSDEEQEKAVEAGKKKYVGFELPGRTLGVIGLGAIGVEIANAAVALGMRVVGFDPTITVRSAWKVSAEVEEMENVEELLKQADFVTFHVPLIEATQNMLNTQRLAMMKNGSVIMNFARNGIVDDDAVLHAIETGKIHAYVSDFPSRKLKNRDQVITLPHLGASTVEAEENCAVMIADQMRDFLENGNIRNSVNFPNIKLPRGGAARVALTHRNMPDMIAKISSAVGDAGYNIHHLRNESKGDLAYTLMDIEHEIDGAMIEKFETIEGVLKARLV